MRPSDLGPTARASVALVCRGEDTMIGRRWTTGLLTVTLAIATGGCEADGSGTWHTEEIAAEGNFTEPSLALASDGTPHIGAVSASEQCYHHVYLEGDTWVFQKILEYQAGQHFSLLLTRDDDVVYAYTSKWADEIHYSGPGVYDQDGFDPDAGFVAALDLALDADDRPHIAYIDTEGGARLRYAHHDGDQWHIETLVDEDVCTDCTVAIAVDEVGKPQILWARWSESAGQHNLGMLTYNSESYSTEDLGKAVTVGTARYFDIASDPENATYWNAYTDGGGLWIDREHPMESQEIHDQLPAHISAAIREDGRPHVTFTSEYESVEGLIHAVYDEEELLWERTVVTDAGAGHNDLAVDSEDRPHLVYSFGGIGLEYAFLGP